ncbi:MAG TPA: c-type cytochrome [Terriglobales bacterium]|jgi:cytochrome c|nr:c-type cytochrome [Terriglobales bacterium]
MRHKTLAAISAVTVVVIALLFSAWIERDRAKSVAAVAQIVHGNPSLGPDKIRKYGCYTCHVIPGVDGAKGLVGPSLAGISGRTYIAGELPNSPENITRWIQHPHAIEPHTAMPEMGVTDEDSRDIAAYLYTH